MSDPAVQIRNIAKRYRRGAVTRKTLRDEIRYQWLKRTGRDPSQYMGKLGWKVSNPEYWALKDISFDVEQGEVMGILGRNGAGKSTLLKILGRITEPTRGEAVLNGRVASLLEVGTGFHPELTGRENIYLNGTMMGMKKREIDATFDEIVAFSEIDQFIDTPVKRYSSGMYVRLAFAIAAHLQPEILFIDEVLAVGDVAFQRKCIGKMGSIAKEGRTLLFVSHNMAAMQSLCSRCVWIHEGVVAGMGRPKEIITQYLNTQTRVESQGDGPLYQLEALKDRSGNGHVKLTSFAMVNEQGTPLLAVQSGDMVTLRLGYAANADRTQLVNIKLTIHQSFSQDPLAVCDAMKMNVPFEDIGSGGFFDLRIDRLPLGEGRYRISASITVNGAEADTPSNGVGYIQVVAGDFYGTGRATPNSPLLLDGDWSCTSAGN